MHIRILGKGDDPFPPITLHPCQGKVCAILLTSRGNDRGVRNIEQNLFTLQMIGQRLALRQRACGLCNGDWMALFDLADIAFEVVKSEHQLVIMQAFGPAPELCSLKLKPLDLTCEAAEPARQLVNAES
jgi:hypothetical protein